jgi:hypothetical protein
MDDAEAITLIITQPIVAPECSNHRISSEPNMQQVVERQFAHARRAWARYRSTRQRDAIYGYLGVVFEIVRRWKMLGHTRTCSLQALTAKIHGCIRSRDAFAIVILCTSDPHMVDAGTRSKWSRALRSAARLKPHAQELGASIKSLSA